jgi:hypothetical protein
MLQQSYVLRQLSLQEIQCVGAANFNESVQLGTYLWHTALMAEDRSKNTPDNETGANPDDNDNVAEDAVASRKQKEIGGRDGPDPTRYGDWEKAGRCIDF